MGFTFIEMWHQMGFMARLVVYILAGMSLMSLFIAIERWYSYFQGKRQSMKYIAALDTLLQARNYEEALREALKFHNSYLASVIASGIQEYTGSRQEIEDHSATFDLVDAVRRNLDRAKKRELVRLRRGLSSLATIGSTAPFVGLFGTIVGIINAFRQMAESGAGGLASVSAGVAEALVATAFGILVAVPAIMVFNFLVSSCEDFNFEMEQSAAELIDFFIKEESRKQES